MMRPTPNSRRHAASGTIRYLTLLLQIIACCLLTTTIYLFHLHHYSIQHNPDYGNNNEGVHNNSPGGSALRHKLDLANFILQKGKLNQNQDGGDVLNVKETAKEHGWKGNSVENFVKPVIIDKNEKEKEIKEEPNKSSVKKDATNNYDKSYLDNIQSWPKLQRALLQNNMLPSPIPRTQVQRGFSGLPSDQTPSLNGALRGTIHCPNTDSQINEVLSSMLAFWNEPRGVRDELAEYYYTDKDGVQKQHPFIPKPLDDNFDPRNPQDVKAIKTKRRRYLTFEPDTGGWNNLRISFENILILAALSGRTLVLPPEQTIYLLDAKRGDKRGGKRQYTDYFNLTENSEFLKRVPIITAEDFLHLEGGDDGFVPLTGYNTTKNLHLYQIAKSCEERKKSDVFCEDLYDHYLAHGQLAPFRSEPPPETCFIVDRDVLLYGEEYIPKIPEDIQSRIKEFCKSRKPTYYNKTMHDAPVWHFETMDLKTRLLTHSYALIFFTDPIVDHFYKRFARDYFRYRDDVYCAAAKIILAMQYENDILSVANNPSTDIDRELVGGYSSLHVRRGDLQFKEVIFDSATWYENTKELWKPHEIIYIATDERDASFFDDFREKHSGPLHFFDDFKALAGLDSIDKTLYGMIDTIVAGRGSVFAGTWFSTFSGYICRLRGYWGMSKYFTYYSYLERKYFMHEWMNVGSGSYYAREYPTAWTGTDGDEFVDNDNEPRRDVERDTVFPRDEMETFKEIAEGELSRLGRGVAGRPMRDTPALLGASRGHVTCDVDVDVPTVYWNDPQGHRDYEFTTPFRVNNGKPKYLAFTPDMGGFNNIRMSFEIILILAAALDRILVLPPEQPMYLLRNDAAKRHRGLDAFFDMKSASFRRRVKFMTMEEFVMKEGLRDLEGEPQGQFPADASDFDNLVTAAKECNKHRPKMNWKEGDLPSCDIVHEYLSKHGTTPQITASHHQCLIFDKGMFDSGTPDNEQGASEFCSSGNRKLVYVTKEFQEPQLLYIQAGKPPTRMLAHFYGYMYFSDPAIGNYYKRLIRDLLHFRPEINCAAGKIIKALQDEGRAAGLSIDTNGAGGYSALHIRRGDFQYKKMKLSGDEWLMNTRDVLKMNEILYIATDEADKDFFDPFRRAGFKLHFLSDYIESAALKGMDPNVMGMVETVVCSQGRTFAGTFRSTFSGYINRLRGYRGLPAKTSFYGSDEYKLKHHDWENVNRDTYAREWPDGWIGIDADVEPSHDVF